jgi:RNA ligase (TIGR02306 family)
MYKNNFGKKVLFLFLGRRRDAKASFWPDWVVKTDEERVQNLPQLFPPDNTEWFVTEKIDGTSTTMTMKRKHFNRYDYYVCSRNVCFDKADKECFYETNVYTEMAEKYKLEDVLKSILKRYNDLAFVTIQGETYGKGIQDRDYHMNDIDFKVFNLILGYKTGEVKRLNPKDMTEFLVIYGLPCVPILEEHFILPNSIDEMVAYADGDSVIDGDYREGVVLRTYDGVNSFKAVSNTYLLSKFGSNQ